MQRIIRLTATLFFGLAVLALFSLLCIQMANHYFEGVAERSIRKVFREGTETKDGVSYDTVCRNPELGSERFSHCDPLVAKGERLLRSVSCNRRGFLGLLGKRWTCIAKFADGSTLRLHVTLGFGSRHLKLVLPFRAPGA